MEAVCHDKLLEAQKAQKGRINNPEDKTLSSKERKDREEKRIRAEEMACDITEEVEHLREVKDIRDELKIIHRVFADQAGVVSKYVAQMKSNKTNWSATEARQFADLEDGIDFKMSKTKRLQKDALDVENSVCSLAPFDHLRRQKQSRRLTMSRLGLSSSIISSI